MSSMARGAAIVEEAEVREINRAVVRKYLESVAAFDLQGITECLAENVVQHYVAPSHLTDDGSHNAATISSRDSIVHEIETCFHDQLYQRGTVTITIQNLVAEGDLVAGRFILAARTVRADEEYKNYYHFLYRCEKGRVAEYWEYLDTKYSAAKLFGL
jgi:ketosteroid isomerase-like protein